MGRVKLYVEQAEALPRQPLDQSHQGDFAGVSEVMEHGLAEERATKGNTVQSAGQAIALPRLDTVGVPETVQARVCLNDLG